MMVQRYLCARSQRDAGRAEHHAGGQQRIHARDARR
jgi:hypothetical protein